MLENKRVVPDRDRLEAQGRMRQSTRDHHDFGARSSEFEHRVRMRRLAELQLAATVKAAKQQPLAETRVPEASGTAKPLQPSRVKAAASYQRAMECHAELKGRTLRAVHKWLKEHDPDEDYKLPRFPTWMRYLNDAQRPIREAAGEQLASKRVGRPHGPSIVHYDQIENRRAADAEPG